MNGVLVVGDLSDGATCASTNHVVALAERLGLDVHVAVVVPAARAPRPSDTPGVTVVTVSGPEVDDAGLARALDLLLERFDPSLVLLPMSLRRATVAAQFAERVNSALASDVIDLQRSEDGRIVMTRTAYGGKALIDIGVAVGHRAVALVRGRSGVEVDTVWAPKVSVPEGLHIWNVPDVRVRRLSLAATDDQNEQLARADLVISVGRGIGDQANIPVFVRLAERVGASLGCSRPLVDAGWLDRSHQVGQSGAAVRPKLYIAFGVSGAWQHVVGMRESQRVVAVNTDSNAPLVDVADIVVDADAVAVAEQMLELLDRD